MYPFSEHFIVRPGPAGGKGTIVPLIAVDQLPDWMQLVGVPRELNVEQAVGLANLGVVACDGESSYDVRLRTDKIRAIMTVKNEDEKEVPLGPGDSTSSIGKENQTVQTQETLPGLQAEEKEAVEIFVESTTEVQVQGDSLTERKVDEAERTQLVETYPTPKVQKTRAWADDFDDSSPNIHSTDPDRPAQARKLEGQRDKTQNKQKNPSSELGLSASRHNTASGAGPVPADKNLQPHSTDDIRDARPRRSIIPRVKDKFFGTNPDTVYCRHWCHYGTCKWGWECRYQHRMPSNLDGLREVGLKDFPTWYLLMMAGAGFSGGPSIGNGVRSGLGADMSGGMGGQLNMGRQDSMGRQHSKNLHDSMNMSMNLSAMNLAMPNYSNHLSGLGRSAHPADAMLHATSRAQHPPHLQELQHTPSDMELRLIQGRMSALIAGSTAMSNRQKLRQIKEMRELCLRTNHGLAQSAATDHHGGLSMPNNGQGYASLIGMGNYGLHQGRANLYTNASLAANAAGLSAASRRQALREAERGANAAVEISAEEEEDGGQGEKAGIFEDLDGRLTPVVSDVEGVAAKKNTAVREGKLVDLE